MCDVPVSVWSSHSLVSCLVFFFFCFNDTATTEIYTLSLHDALPIFVPEHGTMFTLALVRFPPTATKEIQYLNAVGGKDRKSGSAGMPRPISYAVFCLKKKRKHRSS